MIAILSMLLACKAHALTIGGKRTAAQEQDTAACTCVDGTPGAQGATGPQGPPGQDGVDGVDGRDGAPGANGTNGVLDGKDAVYTSSSSSKTLGVGGTGTVTASCDDSNDLVMSGSCSVSVAGSYIMASGPVNPTSVTDIAGWSCEGYDGADSTATVTATALCVVVP